MYSNALNNKLSPVVVNTVVGPAVEGCSVVDSVGGAVFQQIMKSIRSTSRPACPSTYQLDDNSFQT